MSNTLASALDAARTRLTAEVEQAEAELVRARARARELRQSLAVARELAGIGAGIQAAVPAMAPSRPTTAATAPPRPSVSGRARLDLRNTPPVAVPPALSLRERAALEGLRLARPPRRERASFAADVTLRWEGGSPFAGTYPGRKEALALLELVFRVIDPSIDPVATIRTEGAGVRIDARMGLVGLSDERLPVSAYVRFDEHGRIVEMVISPEIGPALDHLVAAVLG